MRIWIGLAALSLLASGCRGDSSAALAKGKPKPAKCPLTGEKAPSGLPSNRPVLAIKVDNATKARPQVGLDTADIIYEELAEGGITRFLALFHCREASSVGPVRSARQVDPDILIEYRPVLLGYSGANKDVLKKIRSTSGVVDLQYATHGDSYERVRGRPAPHDIFTSTGTLRALSETTGAPRSGFVFKEPTEKAAKSPSPAKSVSPVAEPAGKAVSFSFGGSTVTRYAYDSATGEYRRFVGGSPFLLENKSQVHARNVLVLKVKISQGQTRDAAGNYSPEMSVVGSGEAIVLAGGRASTVTWVRDSLSEHTRLVDAKNKPVSLRPGNTWIHLLGSDRPVTIE